MSLPSWERGLKSEIMKLATERLKVAPLVGAWIEISQDGKVVYTDGSLPSWERGLKFFVPYTLCTTKASLPSWERGLKSASVDISNTEE